MKKSKIFTIIVFILVLGIIGAYLIDINRMKNNKEVIFNTWGYKYVPPVNFSDEKIENAIKDYLIKKANNKTKHYDNEKSFVSINTYLIEEKNNKSLYNVYAWVLEEKYHLENEEIKQDSGSSIPYKFVIERKDDDYIITNSKIPRDGGYYSKDMKNIFPKSVRNDMSNVHTDGTIEKLKSEIKKQVKLYFNK